jgi:hypothetical protein
MARSEESKCLANITVLMDACFSIHSLTKHGTCSEVNAI